MSKNNSTKLLKGYKNDQRCAFHAPDGYVEKFLADPSFQEEHTVPNYITPNRIEWEPAEDTIRRRAWAIRAAKHVESFALEDDGFGEGDGEEA
jgi:hypothetical protein